MWGLYTLILSTLFIVASAQDCSSKCVINGYTYPDANSCKHYYRIQNGVSFRMKCPIGLVWNCFTNTCARIRYSQCCPYDSISIFWHKSIYCPFNGIRFPCFFNCNKYYECQNNRIKVFYCGKGKKFDWITSRCKDADWTCAPYGPNITTPTTKPPVTKPSTIPVTMPPSPLTTPATIPTIPPNPLTKPPTTPSKNPPITVIPPLPRCTPNGIRFPSVSNCSKYYECINHVLVGKYCPVGTRYGWFSGRCRVGGICYKVKPTIPPPTTTSTKPTTPTTPTAPPPSSTTKTTPTTPTAPPATPTLTTTTSTITTPRPITPELSTPTTTTSTTITPPNITSTTTTSTTGTPPTTTSTTTTSTTPGPTPSTPTPPPPSLSTSTTLTPPTITSTTSTSTTTPPPIPVSTTTTSTITTPPPPTPQPSTPTTTTSTTITLPNITSTTTTSTTGTPPTGTPPTTTSTTTTSTTPGSPNSIPTITTPVFVPPSTTTTTTSTTTTTPKPDTLTPSTTTSTTSPKTTTTSPATTTTTATPPTTTSPNQQPPLTSSTSPPPFTLPPITTTPAPHCPNQSIAIPNTGDCQSYFRCFRGKLRKYYCPPDQYWNCFRSQCEPTNTYIPCCKFDPYPPTNNDVCYEEGKKIPSPVSRRVYFECVNSHIVKKRCELGEEFDWIQKICRSLAICAPYIIQELANTTTPSTTPTTTEIIGTTRVITPIVNNTCPTNYTIPDGSDCSSYYICIDNVITKRKCPQNEYYNCWSRECSTTKSPLCCNNITTSELPPRDCPVNNVKNSLPCQCTNYLQCNDNKVVKRYCGPFQVFDAWTKKCISPLHGRCGIKPRVTVCSIAVTGTLPIGAINFDSRVGCRAQLGKR